MGDGSDTASLRLLCPGLLDPAAWRGASAPRLPLLERLLARADRLPGAFQDPAAALLHAGGVAWPHDQDPPSAPLSLLGEGRDGAWAGRAGDGVWLHADPVHLRPDRDRLRLFADGATAPDPDEATALVDAFNAHFATDGLCLAAPVPRRWYLRVDRPPRLRNRSLAEVMGRVVDAHLPRGPDAGRWMALLNETQMLFYAHPVNRARERQGRPVIGGIWTWGGGSLPAAATSVDLRPAWLAGDCPLTLGLARWAGLSHVALDDWLNGASPPGSGLLLQEPGADGWRRAARILETRLARVERALAAGRLAHLTLDPGRGTQFRVTRRARLRVWRRPRPLDRIVAASAMTYPR